MKVESCSRCATREGYSTIDALIRICSDEIMKADVDDSVRLAFSYERRRYTHSLNTKNDMYCQTLQYGEQMNDGDNVDYNEQGGLIKTDKKRDLESVAVESSRGEENGKGRKRKRNAYQRT